MEPRQASYALPCRRHLAMSSATVTVPGSSLLWIAVKRIPRTARTSVGPDACGEHADGRSGRSSNDCAPFADRKRTRPDEPPTFPGGASRSRRLEQAVRSSGIGRHALPEQRGARSSLQLRHFVFFLSAFISAHQRLPTSPEWRRPSWPTSSA